MTPSDNLDSFTEYMTRALKEEIFDYEGQFYKLRSVSVWPRPLQDPIPIWMPAE